MGNNKLNYVSTKKTSGSDRNKDETMLKVMVSQLNRCNLGRAKSQKTWKMEQSKCHTNKTTDKKMLNIMES